MPTTQTRRTARTAATVAVSTALVAGGALAVAAPALAGADVTRSAAPLATYVQDGVDETVPAGATGRVQAVATPRGTTTFTLTVTGMRPNETYGAHAHVKACGDGQGGGHFQLVQAPAGGNTGAYANPANEVWLDLTTDATGSGHAKAVVAWQFPPGRAMKSVIIHQRHTSTVFDAGQAGTAGPKLACLDAAF